MAGWIDVDRKVPPHQQLKASGTLVFGTIPAQSAVEATLYVGNASTNGTVHVSRHRAYLREIPI